MYLSALTMESKIACWCGLTAATLSSSSSSSMASSSRRAAVGGGPIYSAAMSGTCDMIQFARSRFSVSSSSIASVAAAAASFHKPKKRSGPSSLRIRSSFSVQKFSTNSTGSKARRSCAFRFSARRAATRRRRSAAACFFLSRRSRAASSRCFLVLPLASASASSSSLLSNRPSSAGSSETTSSLKRSSSSSPSTPCSLSTAGVAPCKNCKYSVPKMSLASAS
mmetsp:Transcript_20398/g.46285  ORF Transcript_20398/g.46285 Transcript_20398/m.46285 type:complete len:223 (+) Transcript_20398:4657-5325(+)